MTWDMIASKVIVLMDRPQPEIYQSSDQGATFTLIAAGGVGAARTPTS